MRLSIRAKQIAGVTAIVAVAVAALSVLYVRGIADVVLHESHTRAELLANAIRHRARDIVLASPDPYVGLREDPGLRAILQASLYGENVTGAAIVDGNDLVIAHSDPSLVGQKIPTYRNLAALLDQGLIAQLRVIYSPDGQFLELRQPLLLDYEGFAAIQIGVSTLLMRDELNAALRPALLTAAASLITAMFVAALLSQLLLRPIHVIRSGLTRLGKGEFGVTLDLPPGDEFGELGTFFNTVSQQLSADRSLLAGQKANLQSAVEHLEDAVALFNPSGELLFSNPAMQPTLPADAIGRALQGLLPTGHPYRTVVEETLATRASRGPVQVDDAAGGHLLMTHAVAGNDGELVAVLLVARDLAYLSRMQSTLAYSRKLVALGRLTAGIAHEVKNPLNAMMIHLELLRTKIKKAALAPQVAVVGSGVSTDAETTANAARTKATLDHVEVIEQEIRRLDEVVQGFLKFTRPEDLRLQPVNVKMLFEEILGVVQPEADRNTVRVVVDCPDRIAVNGDAGMLRQALMNLAINACQAMPAGGTLRLTGAPATRDRVEIRVEDTGIGIPPENLDRIFDLYFTTKDHGTGIGLSMVFRIVQMHDGEVEVESTPGRGTTFRVRLPQAA